MNKGIKFKNVVGLCVSNEGIEPLTNFLKQRTSYVLDISIYQEDTELFGDPIEQVRMGHFFREQNIERIVLGSIREFSTLESLSNFLFSASFFMNIGVYFVKEKIDSRDFRNMESLVAHISLTIEKFTSNERIYNICGMELKSKKVLIKRKSLNSKYWNEKERTVLVTGGNGAGPNSIGRGIYVKFDSDGEEARFNREDIECVLVQEVELVG
ncbi:hypothetical protein BCJMU51_5460 [Bacillus cereus]|uniref:hypothetical protein n=1 Tax=Bacillus cereus TaxID=1396 RepID=UPI001F2E7AF3|nr:hypothetical protein [Bacillus cereus]BCB40542.1 hypothetical protein BCM0045_5437 [Bacillus cereus]BCC03378.1 hypothetical protein BCM0057_5460 [Bacillus cereus]BCC26897.1 hypothetical protein BCM0079_5490 [Bacillus cereus]BCC38457.1 hypothetical protein BCM0105_5447 [Bacillus cereus]BCC44255.1 hypothetical protein BCJMU01_5422 [Bacillus cereus]